MQPEKLNILTTTYRVVTFIDGVAHCSGRWQQFGKHPMHDRKPLRVPEWLDEDHLFRQAGAAMIARARRIMARSDEPFYPILWEVGYVGYSSPGQRQEFVKLLGEAARDRVIAAAEPALSMYATSIVIIKPCFATDHYETWNPPCARPWYN